MNTQDFTPFPYNEKNCFKEIFQRQKELFERFMLIEKLDYKDFDINCLWDQQLLKDFLQIRFIEELTEATMDTNHYDHFEEEITDALNFLVEAYIIYGWNEKNLDLWLDPSKEFNSIVSIDENGLMTYNPMILNYYLWKTVEQVGRTCNLLKNRLWKESQYLVDLYLFEPNFKEIWNCFNQVCRLVGINKRRLWELWSLKYQVNLMRIETKY